MATDRMLIDGDWVSASNGATYAVPNPATEELVGRAPDATADDMRRAIGAARRAFDDGPWSRSSRDDRARALLRIADAMERRKEEMRQLLIAEAGATWVTHPMQVDSPIEHLRHWADIVRSYDFEEMLPARASQGPLGPQMNCGVVYRQPVGVCAMIPTWNFPVYVTVQKLGPALATGCTMVFKPSPWGPLINLFIAELVAEADLPPGVVNFVTGQGNDIAEALVSDPRVDKVSFTGSVATGRKIIQASASNLKRVFLELGGKSAMIVCDDADFASIVPGGAMVCVHAGQGCAMQTRMLLPRSRYDEGVAMITEAMAGVPYGDPGTDDGVLMGPVISARQRDRILG